MKNEEYEMPEEYQKELEKYAAMLKEREDYEKIIPTLPAKERRQVAPLLKEFDKSLDTAEQSLADEYTGYQTRQRDVDEKREALLEHMERIFIVAKHAIDKKEPGFFAEYEKNTTKNWDAEFKQFFYERIRLRESYDLHNILAALRPPDGSHYTTPMKPPAIQLKEATHEINLLAYEIPEDYKEMEKLFEKGLAERKAAANRIKYANPRRHPAMKAKLAQLDHSIEDFKIKLMDFLALCLKEDGKVEIKHPDQEKLDAAFAKSNIASERNIILIKHLRPELLEELTEIALSAYETPEEIAAFHDRIASREAEELDEILRSVGVTRSET